MQPLAAITKDFWSYKRDVVYIATAVLCIVGVYVHHQGHLFAPDQLEIGHDQRMLQNEAGNGSQLSSPANSFNAQGQHQQGKTSLPRCYTTADASPSNGSWHEVAGGVTAAPSDMAQWSYPRASYRFLNRCQEVWNATHAGEGHRPFWEWEPDNCSLERVTAAKFCQVMQDRKGILLVGDSLTGLATTTLASVLRAHGTTFHRSGDVWRACGEELTVKFIRNDYLSVSETEFEDGKCLIEPGHRAGSAFCEAFASDGELEHFDTLVVNTGAHTRPPEQYGRAVNASSKVLTAAMRRLHGDRAIMIVRNTVPGHWGCTGSMLTGPVNEARAKEMISAAPAQYAWSEFAAFNKQLEAAFFPQDGWMLLDAYSPTLLRADSHIGGGDCLHYCIPGPADHWIRLLYNLLLSAIRTEGNL